MLRIHNLEIFLRNVCLFFQKVSENIKAKDWFIFAEEIFVHEINSANDCVFLMYLLCVVVNIKWYVNIRWCVEFKTNLFYLYIFKA